MDYSDYEAADYIFDLNCENIPTELLDKFDLILDGGTIEHVFHLPNVLRNIFKMLKIGGRIIHFSPSSNHMDHGFYMFSPTFFSDYYKTNNFDINSIQVIRHTTHHEVPWQISKYTPGCINRISYGGLDDAMYAISCVATKTPSSRFDLIPSQRNYAEELWIQPQNSIPTLTSKAKDWIRRRPVLFRMSVFVLKLFRSKGLRLKVVNKF